MSINEICIKMEKIAIVYARACKNEYGKCSLHHFTFYTRNIRKDNQMREYYISRMEGYVEALFFADIINEAEYETLTDLIIMLRMV